RVRAERPDAGKVRQCPCASSRSLTPPKAPQFHPPAVRRPPENRRALCFPDVLRTPYRADSGSPPSEERSSAHRTCGRRGRRFARDTATDFDERRRAAYRAEVFPHTETPAVRSSPKDFAAVPRPEPQADANDTNAPKPSPRFAERRQTRLSATHNSLCENVEIGRAHV